jgi:hypothetical protein
LTESPLRTKEQRLKFCDDFFSAVHAKTTFRASDYREYQLPRDVDKELTDRPYYWLWVEQTGQEVEPTTLRLAFSEIALERENKRLHDEAWSRANQEGLSEVERMFFRPPLAELVTLGSFRLERIMDAVHRRGQFVCAKPQTQPHGAVLVPWLLINAVLSYTCDLTQQRFVSMGLCLTNGQIVEGLWEAISRIPMVDVSPSEVLADAQLLFEPEAALLHLQTFLTRKVQTQPHRWAVDARQRLHDDLDQLDVYYNSLKTGDAADEEVVITTEHRRKRSELIQRAEPRIEIEISQLALIGLLEAR